MSNEMMTMKDVQELANQIVESRMFPAIQTVAQATTLMMLSQAEGLPAVKALQRYTISVHGVPCLKSEVMYSEYIDCGGTVEWKERTQTCAAAVFRSKACPEGIEIRWTIEDATRAGLAGKDTWKKYPRQMLSARVIAEGVRATDPRAMHGMRPEVEVEHEEDSAPPIMMPQAKQLSAAPATGTVTDAEVVPPATAAEPPKGQEAPPQAEPPKRKPGRSAGKAAPAPADPPAQPAEPPKPETPPPQSGTADEYETVVRVIHQAADPTKNRAEAWGFVGESNRAMGTADPNLGKVVASLQPGQRVKIDYEKIEGKDSAGNPVTRYRLTAIEKVEEGGQGNG